MTMLGQARMRRLPWAASCGLSVALLSGCHPDSSYVDSLQFEDGIWLLRDVSRDWDGKATPCRPMLMELTISTTSITLGKRAFPCASNMVMPEAVTLERNGSSLLLNGENVGTFDRGTMDITLPDGGHISWETDRSYAPYRETVMDAGMPVVYSAIPVWRPNESPVASSLELTRPEDKPVVGHLHAATLPDARLVYVKVDEPLGGTLEVFDPVTGAFRYYPHQDFSGDDSFTFFARSFALSSMITSVNITITNTPDPPVADQIHWSVLEDSAGTIDVPAFDFEGDPLTLKIVEPPNHGTAIVEGANVFYTPAPDFSGPDEIEYVLNDGTSTSNSATIDISVVPINDPPIAIGQDLHVTSGSATPITLQAIDVDSTFLLYTWNDSPNLGQFVGEGPHLVFVPDPGVNEGAEAWSFFVVDDSSISPLATVNITISPGAYECTLLSEYSTAAIHPELTVGSRLYYRSKFPNSPAPSSVWMTDGTAAGTYELHQSNDTLFGFDNSIGGVRRTVFFNIGPAVYFTTSTKAMSLWVRRTLDTTLYQEIEIPRPGSDYQSEPSVGDPYVESSVAYLPIHWRNTASQHACQIWKIDDSKNQAELAYSFPLASGPCSGIWTMAGEQYMFVGSSLVKFAGMQAPPVLVKDLGEATAMPWMTQVGDKLFFQTRLSVGSETRIELWVTDGTEAGTKAVKELETAFFEFNVFSPTSFQDKLYFAHRKSLWSSDGTEVGTNIVATIPTSSVVGDGAIGNISVVDGRLYFLATSDASGREPWVSDGTGAGTTLLRDVHEGATGSAMASTNRTYFHVWNGQALFPANDGVVGSALWSTNGTSGGTKLVTNRPMTAIVGFLGSKLLLHDGHFFYAMSLP